jgi:alanine dehydrogenase
MALNTHQGHLVNQEVADAHDLKYSNPSNIL